jgi:carnitine O-acetyltransferase
VDKIYQMAGTDKDIPVGVLTSENRDTWTEARKEMLKSPVNKATLDVIERASFVLCLDDTKPISRREASRACWHGDGRNRFFDKSLQFIVFDNGKAGFNGEHSMMDATPTSRLCDFICEGLAQNKIDLGSPTLESSSANLPTPVKLSFDLSPSTLQSIQVAEKNFDELIKTQDLSVVVCPQYGKNLIKKLGCSPDAYTQMVIQLAYYKLYGTCRATYESAQTKKYKWGRTETCRSVTNESVAWVKAMQNPTVSVKEKGELGRKAVAAQSSYMAKAVEGFGVDRHLLGRLNLCILH